MKNQASAKEKERNSQGFAGHREFSLCRFSLWLIIFVGIGLFFQEPLFSQGQLRRIAMDNGMVVLLKESHRIPLVSLCLYVRTGSARQDKFCGSGIAHFTEHMVFKGTKSRAAGDVFKEIESFGGTINAFTGYDYTGYKVSVPSEFVHPALEILSDLAMNATFDAHQLNKEREVILSEIRLNYDDPQRRAFRLLWRSAYLTHPYKYPILGEEDLFNALSREDLIEFYQKAYVPNNMVLAVTGDIEEGPALSFIKDAFKRFRQGALAEPERAPEAPQEKLREHEEKFTSGLTYLHLGFHSVALTDKDCFALDVLAAILGEGKASRLYSLICDKKRLAYSVNALNYTPREPGLFIISSHLEERRREQAQSLILKQIELVKKAKVSEDELESAKNKITSGILFHNQTIEAQADDLAINEVLAQDFKFTERYIRGIKEVDARDILKVARKYLKKEGLNIVALTPRQESGQAHPAEPLNEPFEIGIENLRREKAEPSSIKRYVLDNGITLLIRENKELPLVSIKAVFKGGLRAEDKDNNGLCNLTARMLDKGTKGKNASRIADLIESKGAHLSSFSGNNSFGLSLDLLSKDFDEILALLTELIANPRFPQREFKKQRQRCLAQIKAQEDSIFESGEKLLKSTLFLEHPYKFPKVGSEESLKGLRRSDLIKFYRNFCTGKNMVLAIFGDVNAKKVLESVEKHFAALDSAKAAKITPPQEPKVKKIKSSVQSLPKKQSLLLLGFYGTTVLSQERFRLEVICQILSRASGRLFMRIREKEGLAYTLGAYSVLGLDPGFIVIYVATTAEHVETTKEMVLDELRRLKQGTLSKEDLAQAKRAIIGRRLIGRQTNSACATESALDELYGLGFNHYLKYTAMIEQIQAEDIKRCANKYFDLENYAVVIVGPDK